MKNIAIIGGHGFIGKNFADVFLDKGYQISLIGKNSGKNKFPLEVKSFNIDVQDTESVVTFCANADVIIWLASSLVPGSHESSLQLDFDTNIKPIIAFLEKAKTINFQKFIYLSSGGTVYGDTVDHQPIRETHSKSPISEYGLSKLVSESYIEFLTKNSDFETFILRPSNVYGKYQNLNKPQGIIGFVFKSLINDSTIDLYDDGRVIRDFISVYDLAVVVHKCIERTKEPSKTYVYNVGSGDPLSIKKVISIMEEVAGKKVQTIAKSSRKFDCEYNVLSNDKIKNELDWSPDIDIHDGLKEIWDWIKEVEK